MSYDLALYVGRAAERSELVQLVEQSSGLAIEPGAHDSITVVRGVKRAYCFTIDGPFDVDAEDVPEEITAVMLNPTHLYTVTVEGSSQPSIPHAIRFSRKAVALLEGAVLDQQADGVWSRGASRSAPKPAREERVNTVNLRWYMLREELDPQTATKYLALCRRFLPEALPRRFGGYEPLQGKLAVDGDEGFVSAWESEEMMLFFGGASPCIDGHFSGGPNERFPGKMWSMSLTFHAEPMRDQPWRDALRRLFLATADELGAVFASAEVLVGNIWTGRSMWIDSQTEIPTSPLARDGWMGLPPYPVWWAYYGKPYRDLALPDNLVIHGEKTEHGTFHSRADMPADRAELTSALRSGLLKRRTAEWVDAQLVTTYAPNEGGYMNPPLNPAPRIPAELTGTKQ